MTPVQINNGNNEIAKFLGWYQEKHQPRSWFVKNKHSINVAYSEENNYPHRGLPFYRSYEWLMPVVQKIRKLHLESVDNDYQRGLKAALVSPSISIETIWLPVVEYAKWYNQK